MTSFLDLANGFSLKLRSIVAIFTFFFVPFYMFYGHSIINPKLIDDHDFVIFMLPVVFCSACLYFVSFVRKMEGE